MTLALVREATADASSLMEAIVAKTGLAVSASGVLALPVPVTVNGCPACKAVHPADLDCATNPLPSPEPSTGS